MTSQLIRSGLFDCPSISVKAKSGELQVMRPLLSNQDPILKNNGSEK